MAGNNPKGIVPKGLQPYVGTVGRSSANLRHGAHRVLGLPERAEAIADELRPLVPVRTESDEPMVRVASLALAQVESVAAWLAEHGTVTADGQPQPVTKYFTASMNTAGRLLAQLGLSPVSRASMGYDLVRAQAEAAREELRAKYGSAA
jgi:hypothetical protein